MVKKAAHKAAAPAESFAAKAESRLPDRHMRLWLEAFFHPEKAVDSDRKNANFQDTLIHLLFIGVTAGAAMALSLLLASFFQPQMTIGSLAKGLLRIALVDVVMALSVGFGFSMLLYLLAMILEGKGKYMEQSHGITLAYGGQILASAPFNVLAGVPFLAPIMFPILFAIGVYTFYNYYLVVRHIHKITGFKAGLIIGISLLLLIAASVMLATWIAVSTAAKI
ncbi:Yip1 domain protein [uncultured archaeon]|nr:Yip1 domain protein [uncultured archaeon]